MGWKTQRVVASLGSSRLCHTCWHFVQLLVMHALPILFPEEMVVPANQHEKLFERSTYFGQKKGNCKVHGARYTAA